MPKEDSKVFKLQFWKLFVLNDWFKILTNDTFSREDSVNGCMQLNAHKKCPLLKKDLEPSSLMQWLRDNASLTTQLVEEVIEPYAARRAEHLLLGTTWNEAAKWASQKCKPCAITTSKTVVPHPEQVPSLLQRVTENKSLKQNDDMVIDEPELVVAGSSMHLGSISHNTAVLSYEDELDLLT